MLKIYLEIKSLFRAISGQEKSAEAKISQQELRTNEGCNDTALRWRALVSHAAVS